MKTNYVLLIAVFLIAELFVFLPTYGQEYDVSKTREVAFIETSEDSIEWFLLCDGIDYCATGEDLRIANTIKVESAEDYHFLIRILGDKRARAIMSIYFAYWRAIDKDGKIIMSGEGRGKKYK